MRCAALARGSQRLGARPIPPPPQAACLECARLEAVDALLLELDHSAVDWKLAGARLAPQARARTHSRARIGTWTDGQICSASARAFWRVPQAQGSSALLRCMALRL